MGRIKKSKSMISNSSSCFNKNLLNFSSKKTGIDLDSENIINIKNIDKYFFTPILNRDFHLTANCETIISILAANRKFDSSAGIVTDFLINAVSIGENNLKLFCNTEIAQRNLYNVEQKLEISNETIRKLENTLDNKEGQCHGKYGKATLTGCAGSLDPIPLLSHIARNTGTHGLIKCYYYGLYHGGYDINAIINHNKLAQTAKLLQTIGLTPDPCTGVSPAFIALQELEKTL